MDISERAQYMATGHDKQLSLWSLPELENVWNYVSPDPQEVQIRTQLDPTATIVISSSTSKTVTIFDATNGQPIVKCCPGEITTAMCLSNNSKHLITASDKGVIYIWKLPTSLTDKLNQAKILTPKEFLNTVAGGAC